MQDNEGYQARLSISINTLAITVSESSKTMPAREPVMVPARDPVMVPVRDPVMVPARDPVMVPVFDPVIVPAREPVMVPANVAVDKASVREAAVTII